MTKEEAIKILDRLADACEVISDKNEMYKEYGIKMCGSQNYIHFDKGIFEICKALGIKPHRKWHSDTSEFIKVYFNYRDIEFMALYRAVLPRPTIDVNSVELQLDDSEKASFEEVKESVGIFKDMDKVIQDFDNATTYNHEESGVLGKV